MKNNKHPDDVSGFKLNHLDFDRAIQTIEKHKSLATEDFWSPAGGPVTDYSVVPADMVGTLFREAARRRKIGLGVLKTLSSDTAVTALARVGVDMPSYDLEDLSGELDSLTPSKRVRKAVSILKQWRKKASYTNA
jgi:hypothetical protein